MLLALLLAAQAAASAPAALLPAVAAERAFAARAQADGQWTAFRATAAPDAIMLAPGPVNAHEALRGFSSDPAVAVMWWPARVWTSCDDTLAVTTGPWVRNGGTKVGTFTNVWRREADGQWRWVYGNGREIPRAIEAPDAPLVVRAICPDDRKADQVSEEQGTWLQRDGRMPGEWGLPLEPIPRAPAVASGRSADGTLRWEVHHRPEQGANAYIFQVIQTRASGSRTVPQAVGSPAPMGTAEQLVVAEAHGFASGEPARTP